MLRILAGIGIAFALLLVGFVLALMKLSPPQLLTAPGRGASFENVTVVEPGLGRTAHRRVRVEDGRIASIEPAATGAPQQGFLLPGLIDSHVHGADESIAGQADLFRMLHLAHGVTTIRNTGGGTSQLTRSGSGSIGAPSPAHGSSRAAG